MRDVCDRSDHAGDVTGSKLVEQAETLGSSGCIWNLAILNGAERSQHSIEVTLSNISTKRPGVRKVHPEDLTANIHASVRLHTAEPVLWNPLGNMAPASRGTRILNGTEEALHRGEIGCALVAERWEELVQEGGGSVEKEREGAKVEVGILTERLVVALGAVCGNGVEVIKPTGNPVGSFLHLSKESSVEGEIIAEEVVGTSERAVALELDVRAETTLSAQQGQSSSARCGVTTNAQLGADEITVGLDTEDSQESRKIPTHVVEVLLGINQLVEVGDTIMRQKVVVGGGVQSGARSSDVVRTRCGVVVSSITISWNLCNC